MDKKIVSALFLMAPMTMVHGAQVLGNPAMLLSDTSRVVDLDEVIVVSQPKENFRLRQQPLASSVFTDREMRRLGVSDLSHLSAYVPGRPGRGRVL